MKKKPAPEFYIRVKLPSSSAYPSCPSGDTDFEEAYSAAVKAALPPGWALVKQRSGFRPATDSDGMSLLRVEKVKP
jgi:hypothetical protein